MKLFKRNTVPATIPTQDPTLAETLQDLNAKEAQEYGTPVPVELYVPDKLHRLRTRSEIDRQEAIDGIAHAKEVIAHHNAIIADYMAVLAYLDAGESTVQPTQREDPHKVLQEALRPIEPEPTPAEHETPMPKTAPLTL